MSTFRVEVRDRKGRLMRLPGEGLSFREADALGAEENEKVRNDGLQGARKFSVRLVDEGVSPLNPVERMLVS